MIAPALLLRQAALAAALAAGDPPAETFHDTVVVVAERGPEILSEVPAAVSVLRREEVALRPAQTLAEWVDGLPGFQMLYAADFGGTPILSARGFFGGGEAEYVQLRVDGVPLYDPESGLADWRRLRTESIAGLEALHGAASSLYGDTALAGVIDVRTRQASSEDAHAAASLGSFTTAAFDGAVGWNRGARWRLGGNASRTDGFRALTDAQDGLAELAVDGDAGGGAWNATAGFASRRRRDGGPLPLEELVRRPRHADPRFAGDLDRSDRSWASLRWQRGGFAALGHALRRDGDTVRTLLLLPELADTAHRELETGVLGATLEQEIEFRLASRQARLRAGAEGGRETLRSRYLDPTSDDELSAVDAERRRLGLYATGGFDALDRLRLVAGARWDRVDDRGGGERQSHEAWSPRLGVVWQVERGASGETSLFVQASRAFKTPTLDQLFDPRPFPDSAGGSFHISNAELAPQRARTREAGARGERRVARWQLTVYRTAVEDEIDFDPETFTYRNIGASTHDGVEAGLALRQDRRLRPSLTYTWTKVTPDGGENAGFQLKNIPRHLLRLGLQADLGRLWSGDLRASWIAGRFLDDRESVPLDDIWVLDLRVRRVLERGSLYLDVLNLTDRSYAALGYVLQNAAGEAVPLALPATGIAARAGFDLRF